MRNLYSPLRYPGGKGKLSKYIQGIFSNNGLNDGHYVEPYAGGAAVALYLLFMENASHIHINDLDKSIYAFWSSVLYETDALCRKIGNTKISVDEWHKQKNIQKNKAKEDLLTLGFSTFFLNRTNRSGIIKGGIIGGLKQKGQWKINARFNKKELIRRIERIANYRNRISLYNLDAKDLIEKIIPYLPVKTLLYLDPPYYQQGKRLYQNHYNPKDHEEISQLIQTELTLPWIISYDNVEAVHLIYKDRKRKVYNIGYSARNAYKGTEVIVFSDNVAIPELYPINTPSRCP